VTGRGAPRLTPSASVAALKPENSLDFNEEITFLLPRPLVERLATHIASVVLAQLNERLPPPDTPWLDFDGACAYLGFGRDKLYKLTAARAIPCRKKANGQGLRFRRDELDAWMCDQYPRLDRLP
jgi:excisionase family DNA binding protein